MNIWLQSDYTIYLGTKKDQTLNLTALVRKTCRCCFILCQQSKRINKTADLIPLFDACAQCAINYQRFLPRQVFKRDESSSCTGYIWTVKHDFTTIVNLAILFFLSNVLNS